MNNKSYYYLGHKFQDEITGFTGICVGYVEYISGCHQVLLVPKAKKGSTDAPQGTWYDVQRLKRLAGNSIQLKNGDNPGFDQAPPIR